MTAITKANVDFTLVSAFVDGIRASVSISEMTAFVSPAVCVSRLF